MIEFLIGELVFCLIGSYVLFHVILLFPRSFSRPYKVLDPTDTFEFNQKSITAGTLSNTFKPIIRQSFSLRGPQPYDIWYEVIEPENELFIDVLYRVRWLNENHPNKFLDIIYQVFRTFYFGSRQDLEFILIRINRSSEKISTIKFETDRSLDPDHASPEHIIAQLSVIKDSLNRYESSVEDVIPQSIELTFTDKHPVIEVLTWNHVFMVGYLSKKFNEYDLPITFVTEKQYKKYRLDRRSWVDYGRKINKKMPLQIASLIASITLLGSFLILSLLYFI